MPIDLKDKRIWDYVTLPVVTKVRQRVATICQIHERAKSEAPINALMLFCGGILQEADIDLDEFVKFVESQGQAEKVVVKTVQLESEEDESDVDAIFDDELHALETVGLPTERDELEDMKKGNIISVLYSNADVVSFLGLPETEKACGKEYTKSALLDFIFEEDDE